MTEVESRASRSQITRYLICCFTSRSRFLPESFSTLPPPSDAYGTLEPRRIAATSRPETKGSRISANLRIPGGTRTIALIGVAIVGGLVLWLRSPLSMPATSQPVAFNHRRHTQDLKIDCSMCHKYVNTGAHAGLPDEKTCRMCHQVKQGTSPEAARLTTLLTRGDALQFNKLFRLPPHVRFTHRRHVGLAKLPCADCHGAIADTDRPPARPLKIIRMQVCLACHLKSGQTQDCVECHR